MSSNVFEIGPIAELKQILRVHICKICRGRRLDTSTKRLKFLECLEFFDNHPKTDGLLTDAVNSLNYSIKVSGEHFKEIITKFISDYLDLFIMNPEPIAA